MFKIVTLADYTPGILALLGLIAIWGYAFYENTHKD